MQDGDREAINRFLHSIFTEKKPRPEDCRAAARLIVEQRGFRHWAPMLALVGRSGGPGRRSAPDKLKAIRSASALRAAAGDRDPTKSEFERVADRLHVSERTLRRHWKAQRANVTRPISYRDWLDEYSPEMETLRKNVGTSFTEFELLKLAIEYRQAPADKRASLCQEFRKQTRIVDTE